MLRVFHSFSIGRMILTKKPWIYDPNGDSDKDDVTDQYKNKEGMRNFLSSITSQFINLT